MERDSSMGGGRLAKSSSGTDAPSPAEKSDEPSPPAAAPAVREQDRFMPIANVIRIMRRVLPTHAKIADDAKETVQECVSEYISFVTSEANERCQQEQRKTITAEDLLWAMSKLGFDDYVQPLSLYLQRYREAEGDGRGGPLAMPLKRATSDAGLFHHHGFHPASGGDPHHPNLQYYFHHYPPPPPPGFFIGSAGTSGGGEGEQMQGRYYRDGPQGAPKDGFHPFAPYK